MRSPFKSADRSDAEASTAPEVESTVRFTAEMVEGDPVVWETTVPWEVKSGVGFLYMQKVGQYGIDDGEAFYPPQAIRKITWEILPYA
jgi:hypothetical protein